MVKAKCCQHEMNLLLNCEILILRIQPCEFNPMNSILRNIWELHSIPGYYFSVVEKSLSLKRILEKLINTKAFVQ